MITALSLFSWYLSNKSQNPKKSLHAIFLCDYGFVSKLQIAKIFTQSVCFHQNCFQIFTDWWNSLSPLCPGAGCFTLAWETVLHVAFVTRKISAK